MSETERIPKYKLGQSVQYDLFTTLLGYSKNDAELSNLLDLWDSVPKYFVSRRQQSKMRTNGVLPIVEKNFEHKGQKCSIEITPAKIKVNAEEKEFYPAETEELIEDVLRKIFLNQQLGSHDSKKGESWVKFSLQMIKKELDNHGKKRSINEIKDSIKIMKVSNITIKIGPRRAYDGAILPETVINDRLDYISNPASYCAARFSSLVSKGIDNLAFKQYNQSKTMDLENQLSRWIFKRLSSRFLNAGFDAPPFSISFDEIDTNSGLLHNNRKRDRIDCVRKALAELKTENILSNVKEKTTLEGNKIIDIGFLLTPSRYFISEMKASNKRNNLFKNSQGSR